MIAETDSGSGDPRTLARVSIEDESLEMAPQDRDYGRAKTHYLARFPDAAFSFSLAAFTLFRIVPTRVRYVAGFELIYDLTGEESGQAGLLIRTARSERRASERSHDQRSFITSVAIKLAL